MLVLTFQLGHSRFGIEATAVQEVVRAVAIAALPTAPPIVEGVINVRGTIVPVLDIRARFALTPSPLHPSQHFVIAHAGTRLAALRADRAEDLHDVPADALESPAESTPGVGYVAGIARLPDGLIVIHDLDAFLSAEEGWSLDTAMVGAR